MRKRIRIFSFMVLCFYLTGCGSYRGIKTPGPGESPGNEESLAVEAGDKVRVALVDGTTLEGVVVSSDRETLTIDVKGEATGPAEAVEDGDEMTQDHDRRALLIAEIVRLDRYDANTWNPVALVVLQVVVVGAVVAVAAFGIAMSRADGFWGGQD